jgi:arylsulfatase A-like enzyme
MTGRYQQRFGHEFNPGPAEDAQVEFGLSLAEKTMGDRMRAAGYVNGWFGKSHLGYKPEFHPLKRGFDEYFGFLGGAHDYFDAMGDSHNPILRGTNRVSAIGYTTEDFAEETVKFIRKHKDEPWFVYLAFNAVHAPLEAPDKYTSRFGAITDKKRHTFAGMLSAMDDAVGYVLSTVRETGKDEDTVVFFISDNGGPTAQTTSGNGPLRGFKTQTWEGGIRIPYMIQWKGHLPAGKVDDRPVIQLDILPTALSAAGVKMDPSWKLDGVNLLPYIAGEKKELPHKALFWRMGAQLAVREGDWKLVKGSPHPGNEGTWGGGHASVDGAELYNLAKDIGEKNNLAADDSDKAKELAADWNKWNSELIEPRWRPGGRKAANVAAATSNANSTGPWKKGDTLISTDAPQVANRGFTVSAEIEAGGDGVIVAQGATANGYALYVKDGKLGFALRSKNELTTVTADSALGTGRMKVEAKLAADGGVTIFVDGKQVATGHVPNVIAKQPGRPFSVGSSKPAIGDYPTPGAFPGNIENVRVEIL